MLAIQAGRLLCSPLGERLSRLTSRQEADPVGGGGWQWHPKLPWNSKHAHNFGMRHTQRWLLCQVSLAQLTSCVHVTGNSFARDPCSEEAQR